MAAMDKKKPSYQQLEDRVAELESELEKYREKEKDQGVVEDRLVLSPLLRQALDNIPDLIWVKDVEKRILFANQATCKILYKCENPADAVGKNDLYFAIREREAGYDHTFGEQCVDSDDFVHNTGKSGRFREFGRVRGEDLILDVTKSPVVNTKGEVIGTVGCARDITKAEQTEHALKNASTFLRDVTDEIDSIAVQGYDENRVVTLWNRASETLYGYTKEEAIGKRIEDLIIPSEMKEEVISAHHRWINFGEKIPSGELILRNKANKPVPVFSSHVLKETSYGREMFCVDIDLSPLKEMEEKRKVLEIQLRQAQKMEAIGVLAGGIAHDFNNILAVILGYADIGLDKCVNNPSITEDFEQIYQAGERAKKLVGQILDFSRQRDVDVVPIMPGFVVKEALKMIRSSLPSTIAIESEIDISIGRVLADPTQIHQLCMNLCTNAYQAMEDGGGVLTVGLRPGNSGGRQVIGMEGLSRDDYILLSVADTGPGMTESVKAKIFDPYFTTKDVGKGTGLGLSIVHGIVQSMDGFIQCHSTVGQGTEFEIYLPLVHEFVEKTVEDLQSLEIPAGNESILFVDDEETLGTMAKAILEPLGYRVVTHKDAIEALTHFCGQPEAFDLIVSDFTMPEKNGLELAKDIHKIRQDVPVIICTGNHGRITDKAMEEAGVAEIAYKPLSGRSFALLIRQVLNGRYGDYGPGTAAVH